MRKIKEGDVPTLSPTLYGAFGKALSGAQQRPSKKELAGSSDGRRPKARGIQGLTSIKEALLAEAKRPS